MIREKKQYQVLLVEDNPGDVALTRLAFQDKDCQITVLSDGEEAIAYLQKKGIHDPYARPDLILLDFNLPKIDGREVLKKIKQDPHICQIPVIVLSTSNDQHDVNIAYSLHANCFIRKPLELDAFIDLIRLIDAFWLSAIQLPSSPD